MVVGVRTPYLQSFAVIMLHADRLLPADPGTRRVARSIYEQTSGLPIVSPHGHVSASLFADDGIIQHPARELVTRDHYLLRMLHSQGVAARAPRRACSRRRGGGDGRPADLADLRRPLPPVPGHAVEAVARPHPRRGARGAGRPPSRDRGRGVRPGRGVARRRRLPAAGALRTLRHRAPGHHRPGARSARGARQDRGQWVGGQGRAHLPPGRRGRSRPSRLRRATWTASPR